MRPLKALLVTSPEKQLNAVRVNVVKRALNQTSAQIDSRICSTDYFNTHLNDDESFIAHDAHRSAGGPRKYRIGGQTRQYIARQLYGKENHDEITIRSA